MQSKVYHKLKSKTVRDLYWLLFSEAPLSDTYDLAPYSLFPKEILEEWQNKSVNYFLALDKSAMDIENFVKRKKNKRLGFYAEALLSYFFQTFKEVELLLQNVQIIDELKRTVGEIDFIILYDEQVIHLECAVKYYLLKDANQNKEASQWVGPKLKDNLELKLNKIIQHQIPLGSRKEIQEKLVRPIDSSYLFLNGVFFAEPEISPGRINRKQANHFIRESNLENLKIKPVKILTRPNWLSALYPNQMNDKLESMEIEEPLIHPILCMFDDGKARFIVQNDWGQE